MSPRGGQSLPIQTILSDVGCEWQIGVGLSIHQQNCWNLKDKSLTTNSTISLVLLSVEAGRPDLGNGLMMERPLQALSS